MNKNRLKQICVDYVIDCEYPHLKVWLKENIKSREPKRKVYLISSNHILWDLFEYKFGKRERDRRFWEEYREAYPETRYN